MHSRTMMTGAALSLVLGMSSTALAARAPAPSAQLQKLAVSEGHWVYHGQMLGAHGKPPTPWTWHEHCAWSANRVFMMCSFSNSWGGRHVDSLVVDTYNPQDKTFWHYEIFNSGEAAGKPFASKMQIDGPMRTETWTQSHKGKVIHQRIVYKFASDSKVGVRFQQSPDGRHWTTTAIGTGEKAGM